MQVMVLGATVLVVTKGGGSSTGIHPLSRDQTRCTLQHCAQASRHVCEELSHLNADSAEAEKHWPDGRLLFVPKV